MAGILEQCQHPVANQVDGRLMPGHQQQEDHRHQLVFAQLFARFLGLHERAEQVIARRVPTRRDEPPDVTKEGHGARYGPEHPPPRRAGRDDGASPSVEPTTGSVWHAQHLGDDGRRDGKGVIADEIHTPSPAGRGEQVVGERLDSAAHLFDKAGRKGPMHQGPQPRVIGRVEVQHVSLQGSEHPRDPRLLGGLLGGEGDRLVLDEASVL